MYQPLTDCALDGESMKKWDCIVKVRDAVNAELETARAGKKIGKSLEAKVTLTDAPAELGDWNAAELADLLIVSQAERLGTGGTEMKVEISPAEGAKCERCWKQSPEVGSDAAHPTLCPRCAAVVAKLPQF